MNGSKSLKYSKLNDLKPYLAANRLVKALEMEKKILYAGFVRVLEILENA